MMTIASFILTIVRQTLQWTALAGTTLVMGQDSVGRRHRVGADEAASGRHSRKSSHSLTVDYAPGAASDPHVHPGRCSPTSWREQLSLN